MNATDTRSRLTAALAAPYEIRREVDALVPDLEWVR
jgi:hypothetical protein